MQEPGAAAQAPTTDAREAALRTPMRDLPRAEPGTWSDFDESTPPPPLYRTAMLAWQADDLLLTIAHCQALLRERPDYPPALLLCANAQYGLQRYGEGLDAFERLLAHLPSALPRTRQMGHCLHSLGRNPEAEIHYTHPRRRPGRLAHPTLARRRALPPAKLAGAAADLQAVLATHPADPDTLYWHARLLFEQESEAALPAAHAARDAEPLRARTWFLVAQAELEAAHPDRAETARARHAELSRVETSLRDLERQHRRHPDNPAPSKPWRASPSPSATCPPPPSTTAASSPSPTASATPTSQAAPPAASKPSPAPAARGADAIPAHPCLRNGRACSRPRFHDQSRAGIPLRPAKCPARRNESSSDCL
ncbi:MAG: hypothetical protein R3E96_06755 [Planctomycetota bacterium]